ncbi:AbiV family abortive infection protein [Streptomyces sp. NPDC055078]
MAMLLPDPEETDRVLIALADQAQSHARKQLRAAQAILDTGIWPIAFANAALALEEMGKSVLCLSVLIWPDAKRQAAAEGFRAAVNDHEFKAFCVYFVLGIMGEEPPEGLEQLFKQARADARRTNRRKFRSLYTDSNATGNILSPQDITEEHARDMVRIVEMAMTLAVDSEEALSRPSDYLAMVRRFRETDPSGAMWDAAEGETESILAATRTMVWEGVDVEEALRGTPLATFVDRLRGPQTAAPSHTGPEASGPSSGGQPNPA